MKYLDEYRDANLARSLAARIRETSTKCWRVMEICGGQTHTMIRYGIDEILSGVIEPVHGPGCPVCVTPLEKIDRALAIAARPEVILTTFGDMMRVPGSSGDLLQAKARGGDVRMVYSPIDAVKLAEKYPEREVIFFAVGFETTAPANAMAAWLARKKNLPNFSLLVSHVKVPPAIDALMCDPDVQVQGFIAPGHVCTIMGFAEYEELARQFGIPFVVAGFEPLDLLQGIAMLVEQLEKGQATVLNQYARSVRREGNPQARKLIEEVLEVSDMNWRGIGMIPASGFRLRPEYEAQDAEKKFGIQGITVEESKDCIAGAVLQGKRKPFDCPAFGKQCTPEAPLGAPMVSSEGACAAYYAFRRFQEADHAI